VGPTPILVDALLGEDREGVSLLVVRRDCASMANRLAVRLATTAHNALISAYCPARVFRIIHNIIVVFTILEVHPRQLGLGECELAVVLGLQSLAFACLACIVACPGAFFGPGPHQADQHGLANDAPLALCRQLPSLSDRILGLRSHTLLALAPVAMRLRFHFLQVLFGIFQLCLCPCKSLLLVGHVATGLAPC